MVVFHLHNVLLVIITIQFVLIAILYERVYKENLSIIPANAENLSNLLELSADFSSSLFCTGRNKTERECRFQNLCYDPLKEEFLFFHGSKTRQHGLPKSRLKSAVLDLSSVDDHNAKYFTYTDVKASFYANRKVEFVNGSSILFHRFNPENLMHVLHDDLIPYFYTKRKYNLPHNLTTVLFDGREPGPYFELYKMLIRSMKTKKQLKMLTCFEDIIVGVSKKTTWYQYGFKTPQGPIHINNFPSEELYYFRDEISEMLGVGERKASSQIVLFTRQETRRLVNHMQLALKLSMHFKMTVSTLDLQMDSLSDIIHVISKASILIGVHGAHLVTSLFLPPGSIVVEIFPFGIPSENYTPYKTLANLLNFLYVSWENKKEENSIFFSERPPKLGGIAHLPEAEQREILGTKTISPHLCCHDPYWLFRIFQDTHVDIYDVIQKIDVTLKSMKDEKPVQLLRPYFYPAIVSNISCKYNKEIKTLQVQWSPPFNCIDCKGILYEILVTGSTKDGVVEQFYSFTDETGANILFNSFIKLDIFIQNSLFGVTSGFSNVVKCL